MKKIISGKELRDKTCEAINKHWGQKAIMSL